MTAHRCRSIFWHPSTAILSLVEGSLVEQRKYAPQDQTVGNCVMPKRSLRIIKRVKNVPVIGICELCKVEFHAEHQPAGQQARAQAVIQQQFNSLKSTPEASLGDTSKGS